MRKPLTERALSVSDVLRLRCIRRGPRMYMAGGTLNSSLERRGFIRLTRDGGLWVEYGLTPTGYAALAEQEKGDA